VRVIDHRDQHFAGSVQGERLFDQLAFAFERGALELDL